MTDINARIDTRPGSVKGGPISHSFRCETGWDTLGHEIPAGDTRGNPVAVKCEATAYEFTDGRPGLPTAVYLEQWNESRQGWDMLRLSGQQLRAIVAQVEYVGEYGYLVGRIRQDDSE